MPSGCTFPLKYKKSQITKSLGSNYLALGSIVIIDSFLHLLQYPGKFLSLVSFRYFIIFGYPHLGHLYQYSSVDICSPLSLSISHCPEYSNNFICPEYFFYSFGSFVNQNLSSFHTYLIISITELHFPNQYQDQTLLSQHLLL